MPLIIYKLLTTSEPIIPTKNTNISKAICFLPRVFIIVQILVNSLINIKVSYCSFNKALLNY